jgi:uncharacterized protein YrzB (UPF0473 family)
MGPLKSRRVWPVFPTFVLLVLVASGPTLASEEGGTAYLGTGDTVVIEIDNTQGDSLWIEYEVRVVEGPPVNVWFTDQEGRDQFFALELGTFNYYPSHSQREVTLAEDSFSWDEADVFYVIIDNWKNNATGQNATVDYSVTWETYDFDAIFLYLMIGLIIVIVVVVTVMVVFINVRKAQAEADVRQAEAAREASTAWDDDDDGRPQPPGPYPEWVVKASLKDGLEEDDATGWDPSRDEPGD